MHHNKQSQFELFPRDSGQSSLKKKGSRFFLTSMTLSLENLVVLGVVLIMFMVISFSLGVERGAKITNNKEIDPKEAPQITIAKNDQKFTLENTDLTKADIIGTVSVQVPAQNDAYIPTEAPEAVSSRQEIREKLYTVQVASFKKEEYAQKEAKDLEAKGYEIFVIPKGEYSVVCVGKFQEENQARRFSSKLRSKYKDCLIRSL